MRWAVSDGAMYDDFSADYDRFVDWPARLAAELPFVEQELQRAGARRVLDAACGTGMHAVALAQRGYALVGADLSAAMIERARSNAAAAGVEARFEVAGFGGLAHTFGCAPGLEDPGLDHPPSAASSGRRGLTRTDTGFGAVLCLGNSLPHLLAPADLAAALADFAACLRPNGLLLIQNRNFDRVLARGERWMDPQVRREGDTEWLFLRFYDFEPDGTLTFNLVTLRREGEGAGGWCQQVAATRLRPLHQVELTTALTAAGFVEITSWGDLQGVSFDPEVSPNLVVTARWMP
jgi:glycine/sarcosine N-methyltransferase